MRRSSWLAFAGLLVTLAAGAQSLQVIDLRYRTAAEVIPVLEPLLEGGGSLSGQDYKLFVRTSARNLAQLEAVLAQIDRKPRQLLVSVRRSTRQEIERERLAVAGTVRAGESAGGNGSSATLSATRSNERASGSGVASVQVVEGGSAQIASGSSVPVVTAVAAATGRRPWVAGATSYRDIGSGFTVTPRVRGTDVILDIAQRHEELNGSRIDTQSVTTQLAGRLGEWLPLGGVSESSSVSRGGILHREYATASDQRSIWVKVEAL